MIRNKKLLVMIVSLLIIILIIAYAIYFYIIPEVKYKQDYEIPQNLTADETIENFLSILMIEILKLQTI